MQCSEYANSMQCVGEFHAWNSVKERDLMSEPERQGSLHPLLQRHTANAWQRHTPHRLSVERQEKPRAGPCEPLGHKASAADWDINLEICCTFAPEIYTRT